MSGSGGQSYQPRGGGAGYGGRGGRGGRGGGQGGGRGGFQGQQRGGGPRQTFPTAPRPVGPPATRPAPAADEQVTLGQAATLEPIKRPHFIIPEPRNTIQLTTNCFDLTVSDNVSEWYKYQVSIVADERTGADGRARPPRGPPPKRILRLIWQEIERREQQQPEHFGGNRPAFDGRAAAYSNKRLADSGSGVIRISGIPAPDRPRMTFTVTLSNVIPLPLASLRSYYLGTGSFYFGEVAEALQALNTLLAAGPSTHFFGTRTSFFPTDSAAERLGGAVKKESIRLNGYIELLRGWFQSVRTCERGLQVNINTTSTAFFQSGSFLKFAAAYAEINGRDVRNGIDALVVGRLDGQLLTRINRLVCKKIEVTVRRGPGIAPLKMKIRGRGILDKRPCDHRFVTDEGETDVEEYMYRHFQIRLQYRDLPLVEVRPNVAYPLELIYVDEGNKYLKRLSPLEQGKASDFATLLPPQKLAAILSVRSNIYPSVLEQHLSHFGVTIAPLPKQLQARVLPPPAIEYKDSNFRQGGNPQMQWKHVDPSNGEWRMNVRGNFAAENFVAGAVISSFVVVVPSQREIRDVENWLDSLFRSADSFGMYLRDCPKRPFPRECFYVRQSGVDPERTVNLAVEQTRTFFGKRPDLIFWVFPEANSPDYAEFKRAATCQGVASQAIQQSKLHTTGVQMMINCALKVNGKRGGYNHRLDAATVGSFLRDTKPMIFGADLTHEPDQPSVAVMVASVHRANVLYEETISVQGLLEPSSAAATAGARPRKREMIEDLENMTLFLLKRRALSLRALPPTSMLLFRDGVSEGEFGTVIDVEVRAFHNALRRFKTDPEMVNLFEAALQGWKAKLTVIATIKRHHVRAFSEDGRHISNIPPGTYFDSGITDARSFEFYGGAHRALIGTTRATRYCVLHDEHHLTADDAEQIVNSLCHSYQRTNKAVSLPAPVYYADLIARRVRPWFLPHDDTRSSSGNSESTRQSRDADLVGARSKLGDTEYGRNAFRGENSERVKRAPAMWWL